VSRCPAVVAGAAASAPPGTSLAEVVPSWRGSPAALAAFMSRVEAANGVGAEVLAAARAPLSTWNDDPAVEVQC
jgi:hypothetical protein